MNIDISGKVVVVTGSSRGIGSSLIREFAKQKSRVVITYSKSINEAQRLVEEIGLNSSDCLCVKCDVTVTEDIVKLFKQVIATYGSVDVLINNVGICDDYLVNDMSRETWANVIDVNLTGTFLCCKICSEYMINQKYGKIINVASLKGQTGSVKQSNYSASKAGVIALSKTLSKELGQYNIQVNVICPGYIETDLNRFSTEKRMRAIEENVLNYEHALNDLISFIILLSSDRINGVSGQIFNLDSRISNF